MSKARAYKPADLKRLFTLAANECAWPECHRKLIAKDGITVVGKICHIAAASKNGPRWDKNMDDDQRRSFDNLILMCDEHHQVIDNKQNEKEYKTAKLKKWKKAHESRNNKAPIEISDSHLAQVYGQLEKVTDTVSDTNEVVHESSKDIKELKAQSEKQAALLAEMRAEMKLLVSQKGFPNNQEAIDSFVAHNTGSRYDWVDSDQMLVFEKVLADQNAEILDKRKKFLFSQNITKSVFNASDLKEITEAWSKDAWNPENLDHIRLIQAGIMAYDCLELIPKDVLNDLEMLNWCPIDHRYFSGYLGSFIREVKFQIKHKADLVKTYRKDRYLFENLTRIIRSLKSYLAFDVDDLYSKKEEAQIAENLPNEFLVVSASNALTIRDTSNCSKVLASLPLNKQFRVTNVEVLALPDRVLIVACTANECFSWNPKTDITATVFYKTTENERAIDIFSEADSGGNILTIVQVGATLIEFKDFEETKRYELNRSLLLKKINNGFIGVPLNYLNSTGPILYSVSKSFDAQPLLTVEELRAAVRNDSVINTWLADTEKDADDIERLLNSLQNISAFSFANDLKDVVIVRGVMRGTGVLVLVKLKKTTVEILNIIHLEVSSTITIDARTRDGIVELCCGYLDRNRTEAVMELIELKEFQIAKSQTIERTRTDEYGLRDIYEVCFGRDDEVFLSEEGQKLLKYSGKTAVFEEYDFEDEEMINHIQFVDTSKHA